MGQVLQIARFRPATATATRAPTLRAAPLRFPATSSPRVLTFWHLLSLDAPTVATLWTWFLAASYHLALPVYSLAAMFLAVWVLYAGDRLLDARAASSLEGLGLEARHHFHGEHRTFFSWAMVAVAVSLAFLLPRLSTPVLHLYLVEGSLLAAYFLVLHGSRSGHQLPKELVVGVFFATAVAIPTAAAGIVPRPELFLQTAFFAGLFTLNGLYIHRWEHPLAASGRIRAITGMALRYLPTLTFALLIAAAADAFITSRPAVPLAVALSCAVHLATDSFRRRMTRLTIRAAADALLLTPILLYAAVALSNR